MRTWAMVAEMVASHRRCALVTVAAVRGSVPREPGARMVIAPDGGFRGTIGGGELEWRAIGAARDALSRGTPVASLSRLVLGPDLGQCCGGSVRLLTEVFDRDRLDEVRALAAREAAGPFVTRGRIGSLGVERLVVDERMPGVRHAGAGTMPRRRLAVGERMPGVRHARGADHPVSRPALVDSPAGGAAACIADSPAVGAAAALADSPAVGAAVVIADSPAVGAAARGERPRGRGSDGAAGGLHGGLAVVLEGDGFIVERFCDPRRPVWLFGAGHVGRALMLALAPLPFEVTWIDERTGAFPAAMPASVRPVRSADPAGEVARAPDGALVVVMTHSHARDLAIVHAALAAGRFGYVGLIGSAGKRARFTRRLRGSGVPEARIAELVCPIGLPAIGSKHPAAVATGVAAQLLERAEALVASAAPMRGAAAGASR